jgi:hypothetical protein
MPQFVLLAHDWPTPHLDLMLSAGGVLKTWRLAAWPGAAEPIADHRLHYLDYEGPVSGGRGTVRRVLAGEYAGEIGGPEWSVTLTLTSGDVLAATMAGGAVRLGQPSASSDRHQSA